MRVSTVVFTSALFCALATGLSAHWVKQNIDTKASFRGLSVVNDKIVWASGTGGTVIRTIDGGNTWKVMAVPGAEKLDFRDIEAFDANTAYTLSLGNGESSRIYKTTDGGATWKLQFNNTNPKAFYDAMACWGRNNCIAMSDPVDGKFPLISTKDGGANWRLLDTSKMPPAKDGEAAFAASGTCLITQGKTNAFLVTGGSAARVFRSTDRGTSWTVADTPIIHGTSGSGIFAIAMFNDKIGVIVGGNYERPEESRDSLAFTNDGGKTWRPASGLHGYRSAVAYLDMQTLIAVGTSGTDFSWNNGILWQHGTERVEDTTNEGSSPLVGDASLNAVQARGKNAIWAVGPNGFIGHKVDLTNLIKINIV